MFFIARLIFRNAWRHRLRTTLTLLGMVVAVLAFGLLRTFVDAWYAGVESAAANRVISRNAVSLVFPLPLSYRDRIRAVPGVKQVSWANWFGGIYKEPRNFFAQFAIEPASYLKLYPELLLSDEERADFIRDRRGCIVGAKLAEKYGFKVGDTITLRGTIYRGDWSFVVRGIYHAASKKTDVSTMFFHWDLLNESLKKISPRYVNNIGVFVTEVEDANNVAQISLDIDAQFKNSAAETLTETEQAFQLSFVAMSDAIITAIRAVAYVVIIIIMAVMANTMAMTARERTAEYATLKALGFKPSFVGWLIFGESLLLAWIGGAVGMLLTLPATHALGASLGAFLPGLDASNATLLSQFFAATLVGVVAAIAPVRRAMSIRIVEGLRAYA
ncbi:ABC transporter permease [Niveibacterium umoris]|uniref:Putative ABC transport system permease protein n=1 Tax=Niveibacterium umoris TaxID=1193620 RepID=A0A840BEQ6_9RHOO|nr:FtsX-like permease family protein [Niveibacterium umoris]MBB4011173.1 putative ABC transport system permease protein [Niveibacterium umoris]